jgi:protein-tyrosine phosphatase
VTVRSAPIPDRTCPSPELLTDLVDWTRHELGAGERVLVHCLAGQGRAPTIVLGVLVRMGYPLTEAHRLLRERRGAIAPTEAQIAGLQAYERSFQPAGSAART